MNYAPYSTIIDSPIGYLGFTIASDNITKIDFLSSKNNKLIKPSSPLAKELAQQLNYYFKDPHFNFDLPIALQGTSFQMQIWQALPTIPVGQTQSYGVFARQLGTSARAVGNACRRNPIPIIIPCHRIVGANGLGGFNGMLAGQQLSIKAWLLQHECHLTKS